VIIPCYNGRATIPEAIESAIAQEHVAEIVVVDDGSSDGSAAAAARYGDRVRVLAGPNAGVSVARNRGIEATSAPFIQFLDADDILLPGTIAVRVRALASGGSDVVVADWSEFSDEEGRRVVARSRSAPFDDLASDAELSCMTKFWAPPAAILYRRSIVDRAGRFRTSYRTLEDARFLFDVARAGARFAHAPHDGAMYRVHPGSKSRSDPTGFWMTALAKAVDVEAVWRAEGSFSAERRDRLADVYNGVVGGLFQASSPEFWTALRTADAKGVPLTRKNRIARLLARGVGLPGAVGIARSYSAARRRVSQPRSADTA
jgi:glycosyltransferase involved in cell wall biosynthesis